MLFTCGMWPVRSGRNGFAIQIIDYVGLERFHIETSNVEPGWPT